MLNVKRKS